MLVTILMGTEVIAYYTSVVNEYWGKKIINPATSSN